MNIIVTGGTDGIGLALAKKLLDLNNSVIIVGKNHNKGEAVLKNLSNSNLKFFQCDLSEKLEIDKLIDKLNQLKKIDVLVNNAGAVFDTREITSHGIEKTFALNHLSYLQLSIGLRSKIEKSDICRIINVSSNAHRRYKLNIEDLQNSINYNGWKAYCRSKLLNVLTTYSFKKELNSKINCNCLHPGFVNSNFGKNNKSIYRFIIEILKNLFAISNEKAALSPLYLATSNELKDVNGKYFNKLKQKKSSKESYDIDLANQVWKKSIKYLE